MKYVAGMKHFLIALALSAAATACSQPALVAAAALAAEPANSGDIPDTQAFVTFTGPGYSVLVPEGWARTRYGSLVTFTSNANSESVDSGPANGRFHIPKRLGSPAQITFRSGVRFGGGTASRYTFRSQSKPNPVTGKSVALDNTVYVATRNGTRVVLALAAPAGADNVDQWQKIANSFRWR